MSSRSESEYTRVACNAARPSPIITLATLTKSLSPKTKDRNGKSSSKVMHMSVNSESAMTPEHTPSVTPRSESPVSMFDPKQDAYANYEDPKQVANGERRGITPSLSQPGLSNIRTTPESTDTLRSSQRGSIYNFEKNETILKQDLVEKMISRLKIGITFLLHDLSPLWSQREDMKEDDNDDPLKLGEYHIQSIYPKGNLSARRLPDIDSGPFANSAGHSNGHFKSKHHLKSQTTQSLGFQKRCTQYTESEAMMKGLRKNKARLESLFEARYFNEWDALYTLWQKWVQFAEMMEKGRNQCRTVERSLTAELHQILRQKQSLLEVPMCEYMYFQSLSIYISLSLVCLFRFVVYCFESFDHQKGRLCRLCGGSRDYQKRDQFLGICVEPISRTRQSRYRCSSL